MAILFDGQAVHSKPYELELLPGVVWTVRPFTTYAMQIARSKAHTLVREIEDAPEVLATLGWDVSLPDLKDPVIRSAVLETLSQLEVVAAAVVAWDVEDKNSRKKPKALMPLSHENVRLLMNMQPKLMEIFWVKYTSLDDRVLSAKKDSTLSSPGAGKVRGNIVEPAPKQMRRAPRAEKSTGNSAKSKRTPQEQK